jgi:hypothetical protein
MAKGNENLPSGDIHHVPFIAFNIVIFSIPTEPNSIKVGWDSLLELDLDNSIFIKMAKQNKRFFLLIELKFYLLLYDNYLFTLFVVDDFAIKTYFEHFKNHFL